MICLPFALDAIVIWLFRDYLAQADAIKKILAGKGLSGDQARLDS